MEHEIQMIELSRIDGFPDHPFRIREDDDMKMLRESIAEHGILVPVIVRPKPAGRYELISGHRRCHAAEGLGMSCVPAEIQNLDRDEAVILMVEANFQRSSLLPSERAFAYRMRMEALRHQGKSREATCRPVVDKLKSADVLGEGEGISGRQMQRFIRLTELIQPLRELVDSGRMAFRTAVELSYLEPAQQNELWEAISFYDATPSLSQAAGLKQMAQKGLWDVGRMAELMNTEKPNQREQYHVRADLARQYIPDDITTSEISAYILEALKHYWQIKRGKR